MTAYGALISLKNTIEHILYPCHISLVGRSSEIIQLAYNELQPFQEILKRLDGTRKNRSRKKVNALDGGIKERVWEFEDLLESLLSHQILSQFPFQIPSPHQLELTSNIHTRRVRLLHEYKGEGSHASRSDVLLFSIDLQCLQDDAVSFIHTLKDLEMEYIYELENMGEDDEGECISSSIGFDGSKSKMIGLQDLFEEVKWNLMQHYEVRYALVGMAGVGKTTLAKEIYQDEEIMRFFEHRAWVTVGRKPQLNQLRRGNILDQLFGDEETGDDLKERLEGKTCLIVVDDVWETDVFESLMSFIPDIDYGTIQILVTARELDAIESDISRNREKVVRFLNEEESKELLCEKVFGNEICPPQLDKAATKIAKHCEGLPLLIVTVADFLSKSQNRDPDYWNDVAEERNSVFTDAYNQISKVLFPSYDYLPQYLKMPFLFMGVFPPDYDTPPSKIINMWTAEGWFLDTNTTQSLKVFVRKCLLQLCTFRNLVLFNRKSLLWNDEFQDREFKTCRLHSSWRHLCRREARKNKFFHVLNKLVDVFEEHVNGQRCLCLQNNMLFGIEEFCNSVRCNCASSTRSLLFFGPYHQYPIPIDVGFTLLRELDALKLRFYTFPMEILTLVQLKYLALTCNGELPTTISKLFNLRVLIIHPHINIRYCYGDPSYVPIQIWDMQELEHIEILGKSLRAPNHLATLKRLSTLVGVNASISTIWELSTRIPNIRKLAIEIELTPCDDHNDLLSCFGCISTLENLETLKCSIINPVVKPLSATPSPLMLPRGLRKLHLSGMGFPWEYMNVIGSSLPDLRVLKLRSYAFWGSNWEAQEGSFVKLEFLLVEDTDLVCLNLSSKIFPFLSYLSMKHCYKLKEIQWPPSDLSRKIEIVDCNLLVLSWAKQLQMSRDPTYSRIDVIASSSFDKKPMTVKFRRSYSDDERRRVTLDQEGVDLVVEADITTEESGVEGPSHVAESSKDLG